MEGGVELKVLERGKRKKEIERQKGDGTEDHRRWKEEKMS